MGTRAAFLCLGILCQLQSLLPFSAGGVSPRLISGIWTEEGCIVPPEKEDKGRKLWGIATIWLYDDPVDPCRSPCGCIPEGMDPPLVQITNGTDSNETSPLFPISDIPTDFGGFIKLVPKDESASPPCTLPATPYPYPCGAPPPPCSMPCGPPCAMPCAPPPPCYDYPPPPPNPSQPISYEGEVVVPKYHKVEVHMGDKEDDFVSLIASGPVIEPILEEVKVHTGEDEEEEPVTDDPETVVVDPEDESEDPEHDTSSSTVDADSGSGSIGVVSSNVTITDSEIDREKLTADYEKDTGSNKTSSTIKGSITPGVAMCPCADMTPPPPKIEWESSNSSESTWDNEKFALDYEREQRRNQTIQYENAAAFAAAAGLAGGGPCEYPYPVPIPYYVPVPVYDYGPPPEPFIEDYGPPPYPLIEDYGPPPTIEDLYGPPPPFVDVAPFEPPPPPFAGLYPTIPPEYEYPPPPNDFVVPEPARGPLYEPVAIDFGHDEYPPPVYDYPPGPDPYDTFGPPPPVDLGPPPPDYPVFEPPPPLLYPFVDVVPIDLGFDHVEPPPYEPPPHFDTVPVFHPPVEEVPIDFGHYPEPPPYYEDVPPPYYENVPPPYFHEDVPPPHFDPPPVIHPHIEEVPIDFGHDSYPEPPPYFHEDVPPPHFDPPPIIHPHIEEVPVDFGDHLYPPPHPVETYPPYPAETYPPPPPEPEPPLGGPIQPPFVEHVPIDFGTPPLIYEPPPPPPPIEQPPQPPYVPLVDSQLSGCKRNPKILCNTWGGGVPVRNLAGGLLRSNVARELKPCVIADKRSDEVIEKTPTLRIISGDQDTPAVATENGDEEETAGSETASGISYAPFGADGTHAFVPVDASQKVIAGDENDTVILNGGTFPEVEHSPNTGLTDSSEVAHIPEQTDTVHLDSDVTSDNLESGNGDSDIHLEHAPDAPLAPDSGHSDDSQGDIGNDLFSGADVVLTNGHFIGADFAPDTEVDADSSVVHNEQPEDSKVDEIPEKTADADGYVFQEKPPDTDSDIGHTDEGHLEPAYVAPEVGVENDDILNEQSVGTDFGEVNQPTLDHNSEVVHVQPPDDGSALVENPFDANLDEGLEQTGDTDVETVHHVDPVETDVGIVQTVEPVNTDDGTVHHVDPIENDVEIVHPVEPVETDVGIVAHEDPVENDVEIVHPVEPVEPDFPVTHEQIADADSTVVHEQPTVIDSEVGAEEFLEQSTDIEGDKGPSEVSHEVSPDNSVALDNVHDVVQPEPVAPHEVDQLSIEPSEPDAVETVNGVTDDFNAPILVKPNGSNLVLDENNFESQPSVGDTNDVPSNESPDFDEPDTSDLSTGDEPENSDLISNDQTIAEQTDDESEPEPNNPVETNDDPLLQAGDTPVDTNDPVVDTPVETDINPPASETVSDSNSDIPSVDNSTDPPENSPTDEHPQVTVETPPAPDIEPVAAVDPEPVKPHLKPSLLIPIKGVIIPYSQWGRPPSNNYFYPQAPPPYYAGLPS